MLNIKKRSKKKERSENMPVITEAKTLLEAVETAKNDLHTEKIIYKQEIIKGKLFKGQTYKVTAVSYQDIMEEIKKFLEEAIAGLGLQVQFETSIKEESFEITMYSDNNSILIGKNGQTMKSLETLARAAINKEWGFLPKIILNVENYNEKRVAALEKLAIRTAKEVRNTKIDVELENMNSYERRIIHNKLANFKGVSTTSIGEEPHRHVVIKAE